ncbi:FAD-dependent oxidoreductase [Opitutaceae bacterium TAV3]|nr:FAD-dependent oxidoreductase [Opitutaceae bacterium TAV3]
MTTTLELTPVFEAARLGYKRARIPALVCTDAGTLLAFCDVRRAPGDWSEIDTAISRSTDQGRTWSPPTIIARSGGQGKPATNPTPIVGSNGTIHFLYQYTYNQTLHITSTDDGLTWSAPNDITAVTESFRTEYNWKVFAPGPGHGIRLDTGPHAGRLLVPVWMCDPGGTSIPGGDHRPSCVATLYSDDEGRTWHRGAIAIHNSKKHVNPSENALAQLSDGRVYLNARSETPCHRRLVTTSPDGATNWTPATFDTALYEPVCMASVLSLNDPRTGKKVLLFCNPDSRYDPTEYNLVRFSPRENGVVKLSYDDGKTWAHSRVIDAGPFSYSDLAASPDGTIYCLYECGLRGRQPHHTNTHVGLARFSLRWIEEAPPPPPSNCDFLVVGSTPAGIAMAVRAARQGLRVILTNYHGHPGGMLANGLGVWDTLYEGHRSPIYDQLRSEIIEYYKTEYGENSPQHLAALPGATGHTNGRFEPKIAERYCRRLIEAENNITYYTPYTPVAVHREGRLIKTVILRETEGTMTIEITARRRSRLHLRRRPHGPSSAPPTPSDANHRTAYNEPHAGRIYLKSEPPSPPPPPPRRRHHRQPQTPTLRRHTHHSPRLHRRSRQPRSSLQLPHHPQQRPSQPRPPDPSPPTTTQPTTPNSNTAPASTNSPTTKPAGTAPNSSASKPTTSPATSKNAMKSSTPTGAPPSASSTTSNTTPPSPPKTAPGGANKALPATNTPSTATVPSNTTFAKAAASPDAAPSPNTSTSTSPRHRARPRTRSPPRRRHCHHRLVPRHPRLHHRPPPRHHGRRQNGPPSRNPPRANPLARPPPQRHRQPPRSCLPLCHPRRLGRHPTRTHLDAHRRIRCLGRRPCASAKNPACAR